MLLPKLRCQICQRDFQGHNQLQEHQASPRHARRAKLTCSKCYEHFSGLPLLQKHQNKHLKLPPAPAQKSQEKKYRCDHCGKGFRSKGARRNHKKSEAHKPLCEPIKCLFSEECRKMFKVPSAMLLHVESGKCVSGWTREGINARVVEMDSKNLITIPSKIEEDEGEDEIEDECEGEDEGEESQDEDDWEVITNGVSLLEVQRSSSFSSFASIESPLLTPNSQPSSPGETPSLQLQPTPNIQPPSNFTCPLGCPHSTTFKSANALAQHIQSPFHSPSLFHLPFLSTKSTTLSQFPSSSSATPTRTFSTLSGLAQHIESQAQGQDEGVFVELLKIVNEVIVEFGLKELRLEVPGKKACLEKAAGGTKGEGEVNDDADVHLDDRFLRQWGLFD